MRESFEFDVRTHECICNNIFQNYTEIILRKTTIKAYSFHFCREYYKRTNIFVYIFVFFLL